MLFASNKKMYFVFADEQDAFFTDSMLRLNTTDYLWMMLRKSGYSNVFFIRETQGGLSLELPDTDSINTYSKGSKKLSWKSRFRVSEAIETDAMQLGAWIMRKKKKEEKKTALVFQGTAFQKCFENGSEQLQEFLKWQKESQDAVILLLPMCMSAKELMLFTSKTSVFARMNGSECLSRPVYDVIHGDGAVPVFDRLSEKLGTGLIQLGVFSYGRICTMLRWAALRQGRDIPLEQFQDYANFLYWYVYSPELRGYVKEPLPRFGNGRELSLCLLQEGIFDTIDERLAVLRKQIPGERLVDILHQICPLRKDEDRTRIQITHDNELLLRLARMAFPANFVQICRSQDSLPYDFQKWLEMRQWISKPNTHSPEQKRMAAIGEFMELCRARMLLGDTDTALRAARAVYENALELYTPVSSQDRLDAYRKYLKLSQDNYDLNRKVMEYVSGMSEAQRREAIINNSYLRLAAITLQKNTQVLNIMTDAFMLPGSRFGSLMRDAVALLHEMSDGDASGKPAKQELTEEEKEKLFLQYENMT